MNNVISRKTISNNKIVRKGELIFYISMVIWPVIHFLLFWGYVKFGTILLAFQKYDIYTMSNKFVGFENFVRVWDRMIVGTDPSLHRAFFNSFQAIAINIIILPIAIFSSYAFYKNMPGSKIYRVAFYIPQLISIVVLTMMFRYMFYSDFGPISLMLQSIFGAKIDFLSAESDLLWPLIWIFSIWSGLGSNVIIMLGAMNNIPTEITESALIDGVGFFRELISMVIPMSISTISMYILRTAMAASTFLMAPMLLAVNPGVAGTFLTVPWYIFANGTSTSMNTLIFTTTVGLYLTIATTPIVILTKLLVDKLNKKYEG